MYSLAGNYKFDLETVCKGSSIGHAALTVYFDPNKWSDNSIVSIKSRPKWYRHFMWDFIILFCLAYLVFSQFT